MPKHWPGGGPEEGGRDAHYPFGKYAVYPGNNFEMHKRVFTEGAFRLQDGTGSAAAVMPYYTISYGVDQTYHHNVGNAFSKYLITDLLRQEEGFDGVVCTDWGVTFDPNPRISDFANPCWGVEKRTRAERFYMALEAGVDQFGDVEDPEFLRQAYEMGVRDKGADYMRQRIEISAMRILTNTFRLGLFENPYLEEERSRRIVACERYQRLAEEGQKKSVVLLKNRKDLLPVSGRKKVYVPPKAVPETKNVFGETVPACVEIPVEPEVLDRYFQVTEDPGEADFAIAAITAPKPGLGFNEKDLERGGNGYVPISLQYEPYTAAHTRKVSIAGGDFQEATNNRSFFGKTAQPALNRYELDYLRQVKEAMGDKPVVVLLHITKATVLSEIEPLCDALLVHYGVSKDVLLQAVSGCYEPSGLLPHQMPRDMDTVDAQLEDVPFDMECYVDADGNRYDFAYGRNWGGVIQDDRVIRYR